MTTSPITPTREVTTSTLVFALVGLAAWLAAQLGIATVPELVVDAAAVIAVAIYAAVRGSTKVAAGTLAAALVTVATYAASTAGLEVDAGASVLLTTVALFVAAWFTREATQVEFAEFEVLESGPLIDHDQLADAIAARLPRPPRETVRRGDVSPDTDPHTTDR